jgi:serine/threonine-protein kinase
MPDPPPSPSKHSAAGRTVGRYRIESEIGGGAMGHVYRATAPDGSEVAVKLVKADLASDARFRKRFEREARIARELSHPRIVPVLDSGEHEGVPFLVQRFIVGESLQQRLRRAGRIDIAGAVSICADVASGLDALHEFAARVGAQLVHRDIKPGNILLDGQAIAYITDFGLAKDSRGTVLTELGQALGTPDYMAPEQIRGGDVGAATDVYALACVVYECVCGVTPFSHLHGMRVLWGHLQEPPPNRPAERPGVSPQFASTIMGALAKDPSDRPQRAGEFARRLSEAAR